MSFEMPTMPTPEKKQPEQEKKVENMDKYEKEKIESTIKDLEFASGVLKNVLVYADFCDEKGIKLQHGQRPKFDTLRYPTGSIAGPDSNFTQGLNKLSGMFQQAQIALTKHIHYTSKDELERRFPQSENDILKSKAMESEGAVRNVDDYEREKITYTINDLEHVAGLMKNFMIMIDFCNEKGIEIPYGARQNFENLRYPGEDAVAGPDSKLVKGLTELDNLAYKAQKAFSEAIPAENKKELESRFVK